MGAPKDPFVGMELDTAALFSAIERLTEAESEAWLANIGPQEFACAAIAQSTMWFHKAFRFTPEQEEAVAARRQPASEGTPHALGRAEEGHATGSVSTHATDDIAARAPPGATSVVALWTIC